ncbi:hypothetical protein F511_25002 [Dorcoceras hygrometricum]|uniref:Uncharacterized protein n=1 Tax=Dorcoceras hygrometricum TaxID=472368 RepID=A0A2Z7D4B4_9LAMI|nr:hypothetical protein F511_25002 [Dorcoceras hygrometricum]
MESEHVKVSNGHGKKDSEVRHDERKPAVGKNDEVSSPWSSPSSSSSSSRSSLEFNTDERGKLDDISTKSKSDENLLSSPEFISSPDTSTHSLSQTSQVGTAWQMKSPPVQTMGQPANYDPNRIPSHSFFDKNLKPPQNGVVASNESGELPPWLEEWNNSSSSNLHYGSEPKPSEFSSLPPVMEVPSHEENDVKSAKVSKVLEKEDSDKAPKVPTHANVEIQAKETIAPVEEARPSAAATSASLPRLSDESGNSSSSFAFPVLGASESGKLKSLKSSSLKISAEKQEKPQMQAHEPSLTTTPKASETRWFSCVFCWPRCC